MVEKRVKVVFPKDLIASKLLEHARKVLEQELSNGWKIGAIMCSPSDEKTVVLYI